MEQHSTKEKYNFNLFNIYGKLESELDDFFSQKVRIGGTKYNNKKGYEYNQSDTLNLIEFVGASKFEKGDKDSEGQQKIYLNNSVFRSDVASKQIDIDVKNIVFVPDNFESDTATKVYRRKFKRYAKDKGLSMELNRFVEEFPFYGSLVVKKIKDGYELVDLNKLRNQQDAKSLNEASYVIIEHEMKMWEAQAMPDWDLSGLDYNWDDDITVYERYGRVPARFFDASADEKTSVDTVSFIAFDKKGKKTESRMLFIEQIDERPFLEEHWKRRKGRWLGVGEIENNFENQKARNAIFNLRMRNAFWSAKKIFQSTDETVAKNLVSEVRDGDVLNPNAGGQITLVNTQTQGLADFNSAEEVIEKNSDQKAFTYEVVTGENMPSGTPFRLGVVLSESANSHFALKKEKLALFIKQIIYQFIFPDFYKSIDKESIEAIYTTDEDYEELIGDFKKIKLAEFTKEVVFTEFRLPTEEEIQVFEQLIDAKKGFEINVLKKELEDAKYKIDIVITGESIDLPARLETLKTFYQIFAQTGDPRAAIMLERIGKLTGEKIPKAPSASPVVPELTASLTPIQ
jgi:hypothetical protein